MNRASHTGVTLSEYAILISLIAIASLGALSLLGTSSSNLLGKASSGSSHSAIMQMSRLEFNGSGGAGGSGGASGIPNATNLSNKQQQGFGSGAIKLSGLASGGVNVSSIEGQVNVPNAPKSLNGALSTAQALEKMAEETDDPNKAALFKKLANDAYLTAAAQASYEVTANGKNEQELTTLANVMGSPAGNPADKTLSSLKGISDRVDSLHQTKTEALQSGLLNEEEQQLVLGMVDNIREQSSQQYGNVMTQNPEYQNAETLIPPADGSQAMNTLRNVAQSASVSETPAVQASLDSGNYLTKRGR